MCHRYHKEIVVVPFFTGSEILSLTQSSQTNTAHEVAFLVLTGICFLLRWAISSLVIASIPSILLFPFLYGYISLDLI